MAVSGFLWIMPGFNFLAAVGSIASMTIVINRLGINRALILSIGGILISLFIGVVVAVITSDVSYAITNPIFYLVIGVAPGMLMGLSSRKLVSPIRAIINGMIPLLLLIFALAISIRFLVGFQAIIDGMEGYFLTEIQKNPALLSAIAQAYNLEPNSPEILTKISGLIVDFFRILPGIMTVAFMGLVVVSYWFAGAISGKLNLVFNPLRPFYLWKASDWWLYPTILGLALVIFVKENLYFYLGINLMIVTGHVYAVAGLSLIEAWLKRFSIPLVFRIILYILILLTNFLGLVFIACLGLIDTKINFKREILEEDDVNLE